MKIFNYIVCLLLIPVRLLPFFTQTTSNMQPHFSANPNLLWKTSSSMYPAVTCFLSTFVSSEKVIWQIYGNKAQIAWSQVNNDSWVMFLLLLLALRWALPYSKLLCRYEAFRSFYARSHSWPLPQSTPAAIYTPTHMWHTLPCIKVATGT